MEDKEIAELFADGTMKVKNTWLKAYDSVSGKQGWVSIDSILSGLLEELEITDKNKKTEVEIPTKKTVCVCGVYKDLHNSIQGHEFKEKI